MASLLDFLTFTLTTVGGFPQMRCELAPTDTEVAAAALAKAIARRRIGVNPRLHGVWTSHLAGTITGEVKDTDLVILKAGLLKNVGTPAKPAESRHLYGLVAEAVWLEVIGGIDVGLGRPLRIEGHDWSVTDPGGDGLTVYTTESGFCFRLWESKFHGESAPVRNTANRACRQLRESSLDYISRFALVAQDLADDEQLAAFYGVLPELWVDRDSSAGVGITLAAGSDAQTDGAFDNVAGYFELDPPQHQAVLHLMGDIERFVEAVRNELWKGCGLWNAP